MKKKINKDGTIGAKISTILFASILISTLIISMFSYFNYRKNAINQSGEKALAVAESIASAMDGDRFIEYDKNGITDEHYEQIKEMMSNVKKRNSAAYVYSIVDASENYKYVVSGYLENEDQSEWGFLGFLDAKEIYAKETGLVLVDGVGRYTKPQDYGPGYGLLVSGFAPILDSTDKVVGCVGVDLSVNEQIATVNKLIPMMAITIALTSILLSALSYLFINRTVSRPFREIAEKSKSLVLGDTDVYIEEKHLKRNDEIGLIGKGFIDLALNMKEQADIVDRIASGDLELEIKPRSEKDKLAYSMISVSNTLNNLVAEAASMTTAAVEGKLSTRGDANAFQGGYQKIVTGFNQTLDAVVNPLNVAASYIEQIGKGEIPSKITDTYYGDFNEIKDNINACIDGLGALTEGEYVLGKMSENDYSEKVKGDYLGIFNDISQSINTVSDQVNIVMGDIGEAADQVASGSTQVADGSQALSQGSTEQASSIQQLTASITEIASQTKENAVNANQASELATDSRDKAIKGNEQMKEMQNSMAEINQSSSNISKIIKVIDDIAFQTNILALNAAVEAARAGQHGKGFAVVAEEVRTLAARSAEAARNTTDLIEGSIAKAQIGTNIANHTAEALNEIVIGIEKAAVLVETIATASNEQASGIAEINKGIEQVSQVVQSNSATAEESAAASEELTSQAEQLKGMVGRFKLMNSERLDERKTKLLGSSSTKSEPVRKLDSNPKIILSDNEFDKY